MDFYTGCAFIQCLVLPIAGSFYSYFTLFSWGQPNLWFLCCLVSVSSFLQLSRARASHVRTLW